MTTTRLTAAVQEYFSDLRQVRASGGATQERSLYGPLRNLLAAVGATLRPKAPLFCVQELADQGAGPSRLRALRSKAGAERRAARRADAGARRGRGEVPSGRTHGSRPRVAKPTAIGGATDWCS